MTLSVTFDQGTSGIRFAEVRTDPPSPALDRLTGTPLRGLRKRLADGEHGPDLEPLELQLVDDLPVVVMIADYGQLRTADRTIRVVPGTSGHRRLDVCAGWAVEAEFASAVRDGQPMPLTDGRVIGDGDLAGWCNHRSGHREGMSQPGDQIRRRLLVARRDEHGRIAATARLLDTYVESDGAESVLHEYTVRMSLTDSGTIQEVTAEPGDLPGPSCSRASASAADLVGQHVGSLREVVPLRLTGPRTCTHLNDVLRSFGTLQKGMTTAERHGDD